jgi:hypothetical protein
MSINYKKHHLGITNSNNQNNICMVSDGAMFSCEHSTYNGYNSYCKKPVKDCKYMFGNK